MISFFTRTYSVFRFDSEYRIGEAAGAARSWRLFRIFSEIPARMRSFRSGSVTSGPCTSLVSARFTIPAGGEFGIAFGRASGAASRIGFVRGTGGTAGTGSGFVAVFWDSATLDSTAALLGTGSGCISRRLYRRIAQIRIDTETRSTATATINPLAIRISCVRERFYHRDSKDRNGPLGDAHPNFPSSAILVCVASGPHLDIRDVT